KSLYEVRGAKYEVRRTKCKGRSARKHSGSVFRVLSFVLRTSYFVLRSSCGSPPVWAIVTLAILAARLAYNWKRSGRSFGSFVGLGIIRLYARLWHGCTFPLVKGATPQERVGWNELPATGPALIVVNHTSSPDGAFVQCGCRRGLTF